MPAKGKASAKGQAFEFTLPTNVNLEAYPQMARRMYPNRDAAVVKAALFRSANAPMTAVQLAAIATKQAAFDQANLALTPDARALAISQRTRLQNILQGIEDPDLRDVIFIYRFKTLPTLGPTFIPGLSTADLEAWAPAIPFLALTNGAGPYHVITPRLIAKVAIDVTLAVPDGKEVYPMPVAREEPSLMTFGKRVGVLLRDCPRSVSGGQDKEFTKVMAALEKETSDYKYTFRPDDERRWKGADVFIRVNQRVGFPQIEFLDEGKKMVSERDVDFTIPIVPLITQIVLESDKRMADHMAAHNYKCVIRAIQHIRWKALVVARGGQISAIREEWAPKFDSPDGMGMSQPIFQEDLWHYLHTVLGEHSTARDAHAAVMDLRHNAMPQRVDDHDERNLTDIFCRA